MKQPLTVKVEVNDKPYRADLVYQGRAKLRLNRLVFDLAFNQSGVEIDVRGMGLDMNTIRLLARGLGSFTVTLPRGGSDDYSVTVKVYGLKFRLRRKEG